MGYSLQGPLDRAPLRRPSLLGEQREEQVQVGDLLAGVAVEHLGKAKRGVQPGVDDTAQAGRPRSLSPTLLCFAAMQPSSSCQRRGGGSPYLHVTEGGIHNHELGER